MKKSILLTGISFIVLFNVNCQNRWSLRANGGIASGVKFVDGYYFSFDIGIPIARSLEISPAFTYASMVSLNYMSASWTEDFNQPDYGVPDNGPKREKEYSDNLSSISILVIFKPFELFNNPKLEKHEVFLGTGVSYNSYTEVWARYRIEGSGYDLTGFGMMSNSTIEPYYCKIGYNYLFKKNLLLGFVAALNGYDGEAEALLGIQFGVKF